MTRRFKLPKKPTKYRSVATVVGGIRFDSKKEAAYYCQLLVRQKAGEVVMFLRQVPLHLPGGVKLVIDFLEFHADETVHFIDVKGRRTDKYIVKKTIAEHVYNIEIEET